MVRQGSRFLQVRAAPGPYLSTVARSRIGPPDDIQQKILDEHRGWVEVELFRDFRDFSARSNDREETASYRLASTWLTDECLGAYFGDAAALIVDRAEIREWIFSDAPAKRLRNVGRNPLSLPSASDDEKPDESAHEADERAFRRSMRRLAERFQRRRPEESFEVAFDNELGAARERLWLSVDRLVDPTGHGVASFCGVLNEGSRWLPELTPGTPWSVSSYRVLDWSISDGVAVERGKSTR
jgi:hypothetical protein